MTTITIRVKSFKDIPKEINKIISRDVNKLKNMIMQAWKDQFNTSSSTARVDTGALRDSYKPTNPYKVPVLGYGGFKANKPHFIKHLQDLENNLEKVSL